MMSAGTPMVGWPERASERGFSLLELVVVVGIAAIVMAVLTLGIRQASESFTLQRAANLAVTELRRAQATAMAQGVDYTVEFYTTSGGGGSGGIQVWKAGDTVPVRRILPPEWPAAIEMPAGPTNFPDCLAPIDSNHDCAVFKPLGYPVQDGRARLRARGSTVELDVVMEPATGRVRVERP